LNLHEIFNSDAAKVVWPFAAVLITTGVNAAVTWAKDLNGGAKRIRVLDEASRRVQFWTGWFKAIEDFGVSDPKHRARLVRELELAATGVLQFSPKYRNMRDYEAYRNGLPCWRRLLLLYEMPNSMAKLMRVLRTSLLCTRRSWRRCSL
jgi:hypothetical protein